MVNRVIVNKDQRLYAIPADGGYSCLGFDVAERRRVQVLSWVRGHGAASIAPMKIGTLAAYWAYQDAMMEGFAYADNTGHRCGAELTPQLVGLEGKRVEVVDAYGEKRRFKVSKSGGWMPCHLELANSRSIGGRAVGGAPFKSIRVIE